MNDAPPHPPDSKPQEVVGLAAIFSFLLPGLGHVFIGAWPRAAIWFVGAGYDAFLYGRSRESP